MSAVCVRCGAERSQWADTCASCGLAPVGEGRWVAWLLSAENLSPAELADVSRRIRGGEVVRPSRATLDRARRALGEHLATDAGLAGREGAGLLAVSVLLTPLVGWVCVAWWWSTRPRAAMQALALTLPATVAETALVLYLR